MKKIKHNQQSLSEFLAELLVDNPWKSLLIGLLLVIGLSAGMSMIKADFTYRVWFQESDPYLQRFDDFERHFGNDENLAVVIHSPSGVFDRETIALVQDVTRELWQVPEVIRVDSLTNFNWTDAKEDELIVGPLFPPEKELSETLLETNHDKVMAHEILPGYMVGRNGQTTVVYAQLQPAIGGSPNFKEVTLAARKIIAKHNGSGDHVLRLTGSAAITYAFEELGQTDMAKVMPAVMGIIILLLLIAFRRISGVVLPFVVILSSTVMALGASGFIGLRFNNITSAVPPILIAISIADAVHIMSTYFHNMRAGFQRRKAAKLAVSTNLAPTLLTSVSTMIGFFSYTTSEVMPIMEMGVMAGLGTFFAWIATLLILVPLLVLLPLKIKRSGAFAKHDVPNIFAVRYARWLAAWRMPIIVTVLCITATGIYFAAKSDVNSDPLRYFSETVPVRAANEFAESHIGGMQAIEIVIDSGRDEGIKDPGLLRRVEAFQTWLQSRSWIDTTISLIDIIKDTNRALFGGDQAAYRLPETKEIVAQEIFLYTMGLPQGMDLNNRMSLDNRSLRLTAMSKLHDSKTVLQKISEIENKAKEMGLTAWVSGKMPLTHSINPAVVYSFFSSIAMAFAFIVVLMILVLRSFKLGLLAMIPNLVPLVFGAATMTLLGRQLDIGTVLVASTCLGIAVDDTIHFLVKYNQHIKKGATSEIALAQTLTSSGQALIVTTVILVSAFGCFSFASFMPNVNFGILTSIVLSLALLLDLILLPALLVGQKKEVTVSIERVGKVPTPV